MSENTIVAAYKAQVSGLQLARTQANQMISKLLAAKMTEEQRRDLFQTVIQHCNEQEASRAAQLEAVMRTALLQLNGIAQSTGDATAKQQLVEVVKALTLTVECASLDIKKENNEPR